MTPLTCPKPCSSPKWHAIGPMRYSHRGLLQALLECDACRYRFWNGRQESVEAAKAAGGEVPTKPEKGLDGVVDPVAYAKAAAGVLPMDRFERPASIAARVPEVRDFKVAQGGGE